MRLYTLIFMHRCTTQSTMIQKLQHTLQEATHFREVSTVKRLPTIATEQKPSTLSALLYHDFMAPLAWIL